MMPSDDQRIDSHIERLTDPVVIHELNVIQNQQLAALQMHRIEEHRHGKHPYGSMRRDCPLCNRGA